jgi:amino acid adenylation domain-containing protein
MNSPSGTQPKFTTVDFNPFADGELLLTAPATESQKEIWASVQMGSDANCAYNQSQKLWLRGILNTDALRLALQELVLRHEALRTTFSPDGINLCIVASLNLEIPEIDLSGLDSGGRDTKLTDLLKQAVETPFDLEHGPLIRVQLIKTQDQENLLLLTAHHIICDGWSWAVLMTDLGKLYTALKNGEMLDLEEPENFSEYAIAQQEAKGSEEEIETEAYWLNQFSDSIPVLDFPTDRPRPPFRTFSAAREDWDLDPALVLNLKQLGNKLGCSFATTLFTSFEVFLHRLTGSNEIMIGIPAAGQAATGNYQLVGHCVNLLPLKSLVDGSQAFTDYLLMRRSIILDAYDHQQFTFGSLLGKLAIPRDNSRIPLVPITFNLDQGLDGVRLLFEDLKVELSTNPLSYENFEISINATELRGRVTLECQYNTNLFDTETIRRRLAEFETLLIGIVAAPDTTIDRLPLLPESELQLLTSWNQTQVEYPRKCINQLFEDQVERTPDAIAVVFQEQQLTYRELNSRANQLAHYLQNLGVKPDVLVGICIERSLEMIVGLLGILKAGGAYVPLDPSYPQERIEYMIADAQMPVLLTQSKWKIQEHQSQVICLDSDWEKIASQNSDNLAPINENKHVAYVIYTSGSTGKPKGVMISHQALSIFTQTIISEYQITADDRLLQFASINFDVAVEEIYPSLCTGATLVIRNDDMLSDLRTFFQACEDWLLTVINLPTAYWHDLVAEMSIKDIPLPESLRLVLIGGEKVLSETVRAWQKYVNQLGKGDHLQLINAYGPTETTVSATLYRIPNTVTINGEVPIGCPLAHLQTYILDPYLQPVPIGVTGELHIGGDSLAIGYLNRPELTDEKFIPNPFSQNSGSRLYKTGDLAHYLPDGNIEYLGRIDNQVKIRGFRIELGEIETALSQHPNLRATVITTREDTDGDKRLVAYVVVEDKSQEINLRSFLQDRLPSYMIPSAFVFLEAMPITPNGKIDFRGLPAPDNSSKQIGQEFIAPSNSTEEFLAVLWADVLGTQQLLSTNDNFFDLGGHSLLAMQVISRCREGFSVEITLQSLFEKPTIAGLGDRIQTLLWLAESQKTSADSTTNQMEEFEL